MNTDTRRNLTQATVKGTLWVYTSQYSGKFIVFITTIILARLLTKEDFGLVGYAVLVIGFLDVVSDLGVGEAIIYHRDSPEATDTAFWLSIGVGVGLFVIAWFVAPLAGQFFNDPRAIPITRVLALTFPISALESIHNALLQKHLEFKRKFIPRLVKTMSKGIISIILALAGFGYWSLILGQVIGSVFSVAAYWAVLPWRPSFRFVQPLVRPLLSYGLSIVAVTALGTLLVNIDYLFIGRYLGAAALGVYTIAFRIPELLIIQFCSVIGKVLFPVYSKMREDTAELGQAFLTTMRYVSIITIPVGIGLALVAEPFILTFFTDKWAEAIQVTRAISIYALLFSLAYNAGSVYKAQGRPGVLTKLAIVRALMLLPALWWAATGPGTIAAVGWTHAAVALIAGTINLVVAGRMLNIQLSAIAATLGPALVSSLVMAVAVLGVLAVSQGAPPVVQLVSTVLTGGLVYGLMLWWRQERLVLHAGQTVRAALVRR